MSRPPLWAIFWLTLIGLAAPRLSDRLLVIPSPLDRPNPSAFHQMLAALPIRVLHTDVAGGAFAIAALLGGIILIGEIGRRTFAAESSRSGGALLVVQAVAGAALAFSPVALDPDPTSYVLFSRLYGVFGLNPYAPPMALPNDPILMTAASPWGPTPPPDCYGPLWTLVSAAIARAEAHASLEAQWITHRLLAVAASLATSAGLLRLARNRAPQRVAVFAFHPLVLLETAVNGHNDILMVACAVWAFALLEEAPLAAGLLLGASMGVKFVSAVASPFLFISAWRARTKQRGRAVAMAGIAGITGAAFLASFIPFSFSRETFSGLLSQRSWITASPAALIVEAYRAAHSGPADLPQQVDNALLGLWAAAAFLLVSDFWETGKRFDGYLTVLGFIWTLPQVQPYYLIWFSPLLAEQTTWGRYTWYLLAAALSAYVLSLMRTLSFEQARDLYTLAILLVPALALLAARLRAKAA